MPAIAMSADHSEDAPARAAGIVSMLVAKFQAVRKNPPEAPLPPGVGLSMNLLRTNAIRA